MKVTYKSIQRATRGRYGFVAKSCWIAHVLSDNGKTTRVAHNRQNPNCRVHPCPPDKRVRLERVLRSFGMI